MENLTTKVLYFNCLCDNLKILAINKKKKREESLHLYIYSILSRFNNKNKTLNLSCHVCW